MDPVHSVINIHHATLEIPLGQEERARVFYEELLGLKALPNATANKSRAICYEINLYQQLRLLPTSTEHFSPQKGPAITIQNLLALQQLFFQSGVTIQTMTQEKGWDCFYAFDPFGNTLEFREEIEIWKGDQS